jgi:hypothetical protein
MTQGEEGEVESGRKAGKFQSLTSRRNIDERHEPAPSASIGMLGI